LPVLIAREVGFGVPEGTLIGPGSMVKQVAYGRPGLLKGDLKSCRRYATSRPLEKRPDISDGAHFTGTVFV
jgi:hypothetical protein